jgi:hypothetical protein
LTQMKKWRVGTLSMGLTLILLGIILFISQWKGLQAFDAFITWWPILFVLLGLEIVLYYSFAKKEGGTIHYDLLSLFFVAVLGVGCLGFTLLTSVGVLGEVRSMIGAVDVTQDLPVVDEAVGDGVKKIVVQSSDPNLKIDKSLERTVHVFGTYRQRIKGNTPAPKLEKDSIVSIRTIGDTLYVQLKQLPEERSINSLYPRATVTIIVPQDVQVEARGANNEIIP